MSECIVVSSKISSYGVTARVVLEEKGVPYTQKLVEPGEIKLAPYLEDHHPFGMMPAFHHGDFHLFETAAIARYVDEAFEGPALQPDDPKARAQMQKWISISDNYIYPAVIHELVLQRLAPALGAGETDEAVVSSAVPKIAMQLDLVEAALSQSPFLAGDLSLADFFAATVLQYIALTPEGGPLLSDRPRLVEWLQTVTKRPSYAQASYDLDIGG